MVLCFIALPVLLILGIFSMKYRILAKDALECIGRTITLRKCKSHLDERIKSHLTGKIIRKSQKIGLFFYKNFQLISIILIIILLLSLFFSITGYLNYRKYGNCNGSDSDGFCVYSEALKINENLCNNESCTDDECECGNEEDCETGVK